MKKIDASQSEKDRKELEKFGYSQELLRGLGGFSNFAVAFSVVSILTGISQLYGYGLAHGGPSQMFFGWILVGFFTLLVSLAMAELASSYPTAGALYHWSSFLGGRTIGWFTACFNAIGMFAILAGIDYGLARFLLPLFGLTDSPLITNSIYAALLISHAVLNYRGIKLVGYLNDFSAIYQLGVVFVLIGALALKGFSQPISFLWTFSSTDGFSPPYSFLVGLLLAQWTLTGYDASAHVTEETVDPGYHAPRGIFMAVVLSIVAGLLMLMAVTLSISDLQKVTAMGDGAFLGIFQDRLGNFAGSVIVFLVAGAMWLCGLATMTSASRMIYAFARDGGLPLSKVWAKVHEKHKTPANAIWGLAVFAMTLGLSVDAYSAVVSIAVIALYLSYGLPIAARLYVRFKGHKETIGPWSLGKWSTIVSILSVLWIVFISVLFILPPNEGAGKMMGWGCVALLALWFFYVRKHYEGPKYQEK